MSQSISLHKRAKGDIGEEISCKYLADKGFHVVARNYQKAWGELDIVAVKDKIVHFFEVKSVTADWSSAQNAHKPEENVHPFKVRHIRRMIQTFMAETGNGPETEFQFHIVCVYMDMARRVARVKFMENIVL